jgi:hypothetical protein
MANKSKKSKACNNSTKYGSDELVRPARKKSKGVADAARNSTKDGLSKTRSSSSSRGEVRQQTVHRQGHPK